MQTELAMLTLVRLPSTVGAPMVRCIRLMVRSLITRTGLAQAVVSPRRKFRCRGGTMVDQLSGFFRTHLYQSESIRICDANYYRHFEAICSHLTASATIKIRLAPSRRRTANNCYLTASAFLAA